ncbi:hypothetical protein [Kitasatospora purpeofusca]|uniref:hypothetical protein n=1 Tax=Kitasatospora purpeofusca TaxID=67352 RepID=UPI00369C8283
MTKATWSVPGMQVTRDDSGDACARAQGCACSDSEMKAYEEKLKKAAGWDKYVAPRTVGTPPAPPASSAPTGPPQLVGAGERLDALAQTSPTATRAELRDAARTFGRATPQPRPGRERRHPRAPPGRPAAARGIVHAGSARGRAEDGGAVFDKVLRSHSGNEFESHSCDGEINSMGW